MLCCQKRGLMTTATRNRASHQEYNPPHLVEYLSEKPNVKKDTHGNDGFFAKLIFELHDSKFPIYFDSAKSADGIHFKAQIADDTPGILEGITSFVKQKYSGREYSPVYVSRGVFFPSVIDSTTHHAVRSEAKRLCLEAIVTNEGEADRFYEVLSGTCSNLYRQKHS